MQALVDITAAASPRRRLASAAGVHAAGDSGRSLLAAPPPEYAAEVEALACAALGLGGACDRIRITNVTGDVAATSQATIVVAPIPHGELTSLALAGSMPALSIAAAQSALGAPDLAGTPFSEFAAVDLAKPPACGDGICGPGETPIYGVAASALTCSDDCAFTLAACPSPGSAEVGDPSRACGGHGRCMMASKSCACFVGYAGDACNFCAPSFMLSQGSCLPTPGSRIFATPPAALGAGVVIRLPPAPPVRTATLAPVCCIKIPHVAASTQAPLSPNPHLAGQHSVGTGGLAHRADRGGWCRACSRTGGYDGASATAALAKARGIESEDCRVLAR